MIKIHNSKFIIQNSKKGFTMVELLLYMGIFSILLVVLMQLFGSILDVHLESQATSSVSQDGNYIFSRLSYDVRQATAIASPSLGASGSTLQITGGSANYTYSLSGNNLMLTNNTTGTTDQLNSTNTTISSVTFKTLGNGAVGNKSTVQVIMTVKSKTLRKGGVNQTKTFQTTIGVR
jgi:prepilin-type N-terminal cleavage/methylation domain-containing protein